MTDKYQLRCLDCGSRVRDEFTNACQCGGFLRTDYSKKNLEIRDLPGIFRFSDWLPVTGHLPVGAGPLTWRSTGLGRELGLENLYITFSGYWPERGADVRTGSFKELEALPTMQRLKERGRNEILQISSAGNTGRAFSQTSALTGMPLIVVVPERGADRIWTTEEAENVCLVTVDGDYTDAIRLGNSISGLSGVISEGGARNVARRDGMGTVMLDGTLAAGRLPEYYFQAVGSGTGGIAAWEAAMRLIQDGRFGNRLPHLCLAQNTPFAPMTSAWNEGRNSLIPEIDMPDAERAIEAVHSDLLTNREPPYSVRGGVYDALSATGGQMAAITNAEASEAGKLFTSSEGIDPDPAAEVAVASLIKAAEAGVLREDSNILLNITGGGYRRIKEDFEIYRPEPWMQLEKGDLPEECRRELEGWVREHA